MKTDPLDEVDTRDCFCNEPEYAPLPLVPQGLAKCCLSNSHNAGLIDSSPISSSQSRTSAAESSTSRVVSESFVLTDRHDLALDNLQFCVVNFTILTYIAINFIISE